MRKNEVWEREQRGREKIELCESPLEMVDDDEGKKCMKMEFNKHDDEVIGSTITPTSRQSGRDNNGSVRVWIFR